MAKTTFDDFIAQLGKETVRRINKERVQYSKETKKPAPEAQEPEIPEEPATKEEKREVKRLDEEFVEKALDYAKIIMKTVRKNFDSEEERIKIYESIRSAINLYLGESQQTSTRALSASSSSSSLFPSQLNPNSTMSEREWNNMPAVQRNEQVVSTTASQKTNSGTYKRDMKIPVVEGRDGKPSVDVAAIPEQDKNDLKVLMGIQE